MSQQFCKTAALHWTLARAYGNPSALHIVGNSKSSGPMTIAMLFGTD